jgi:hypothetical protein
MFGSTRLRVELNKEDPLMSMIGNFRRLSEDELDSLVASPEGIVDFLNAECGAEDQLDIDKTWHAIHYLLTGDSWGGEGPLANAVLGGVPLGEEDVGYGPARFIRSSQVTETSRALQAISSEQLWSRFDAKAMRKEQIYPEFEGGEDDREYVCTYFEDLKKFYAAAAANGDAMILYLN